MAASGHAVDACALEERCAGLEWRHLLPAEEDSEELRQSKRLQLTKLLRTTVTVQQNIRSNQRQQQLEQEQLQPSAPQPPSQPASTRGIWRSAVRGGSNQADKQQRPLQSAERAAPAPAPPPPAKDTQHEVDRAAAAQAQPAPTSAMERAAEPTALPPAAPAPTTAAEEAVPGTQDAAGAEGSGGADYHTPLTARMLPGPGRASKQQLGGGGGSSQAAPAYRRVASSGSTVPCSSSGISTMPSSSGGIPTVPSSGGADTGAAAAAGQPAGRRRGRQGQAEPALGSGRLPLSAGGFLSMGRAAAAPSGSGQQPPQQQRRWRQQQQLQSQPLARMMHKQQQHEQPTLQLSQLPQAGGAFQPNRPSRFAPDPAPVFAPASLTTQIGPSQALEWALAEADARRPAQQQQQQQQHDERRQQHQQPVQQQGQRQQQPQQPQQQHPQLLPLQAPQQMPGNPAKPRGIDAAAIRPAALPPAGAAAAAAAVGTAITAAGTLLGSEWSLPPTPSCMHTLSPDSPAVVAGSDVPGSDARHKHPRSAAVSGRRLGAAAAAVEEPDTLLQRLPDFSLVAETPLLLASPTSDLQQAQGAAEQQLVTGGGQRLFVAETPADVAAGPSEEGGEQRRQQRRQSHLAPASSLAVALEAAAAAKTPAAPVAAGASVAAAAAAAAAGAGLAETPAAAARAAMPAAPPATASADICGLQLQLPQPVLQVVACADGRHVALLLGNYAPAGEPSDVLVLQLPSEASAAAEADAPAMQPGHSSASKAGDSGSGGSADDGSCCGLRIVTSLAVQRSKWGEGLDLTPNCLQLAATDKVGLQLVLSAALELADEPTTGLPAILVLPLGGSRSSSPSLPGPALGVGKMAPWRMPHGRGQRLLAIECREHHPLTCVLVADGSTLLAAGDGCGDVRRLHFDPLWRSYTWGRDLPSATFRHMALEDLQQLLMYRDPEAAPQATEGGAPPRTLLLGISSGGTVAVWDLDRSVLLAARPSATHRVRSLHPVSLAQAGLSTTAKNSVTEGSTAAAEAAEGTEPSSVHVFVGLVQHQDTGQQHVAAVMLCAGGLMVSRLSALVPPRLQPERPGRLQLQAQQPDRVSALAASGSCCWLGTTAGDLLPWDFSGDSSGSAAAALASPGGRVYGCSSGGAVTAMCAVPSAEWQLVAATAGGTCTVLALR